MRNSYIKKLYELTEKNQKIYSFVADNGAIVFDQYRQDFPDNFINFGIAEATMVSVAAGMANSGNIPYIYTIIPFLVMRAYEQIRNDICIQNMNVKIVGIGGGFRYSNLGPTHHAIVDLSLMRSLPNMTVFCPCDPAESAKVTEAALKIDGPVYIRLGTNKEPDVYKKDYNFVSGKGIVLKEGNDITLAATGNSVYDAKFAAQELEKQGISVRLVNIHTIKPLDEEIILESAEKTRGIITVEPHSIIGGLGDSVASVLACKKNILKDKFFHKIGIKDRFCTNYGTYEEMKEMYGIDAKAIVETVLKVLSINDTKKQLS